MPCVPAIGYIFEPIRDCAVSLMLTTRRRVKAGAPDLLPDCRLAEHVPRSAGPGDIGRLAPFQRKP